VKTPGDINPNNQELIRLTEKEGTDHNARVWVLKCRKCGSLYGANSTDGWERKCPECQGGEAGLEIPSEREGEKWNREEHIIAFSLYNQIPFGTIHMRNPRVRELAGLLGRSVGSVSYKLANFCRLDPALQARGIRGMPRGAKGEVEVWRDFARNPEALAFESARLLAQRVGRPIEELAEVDDADLPPPGLEREVLVRLRVNQSFFRSRILSAYNYRCCVTGLAVPALLVAGHIVPWAEDPANRLNPRNGLCLNALHDCAFDRGLMWVEEGFVVRFSPRLRDETSDSATTLRWLTSFDGQPLRLPNRFSPDPDLLRRHAARHRAEV
jgi:putative restriction endonuclease